MEEALLREEISDDNRSKVTWNGFVKEMKMVSYMAAPMVTVSVSQYVLEIVSVVMAGHLGQLSLSGVAIANSFTDITGLSVIVSLFYSLSDLSKLCSQKEQKKKMKENHSSNHQLFVSSELMILSLSDLISLCSYPFFWP